MVSRFIAATRILGVAAGSEPRTDLVVLEHTYSVFGILPVIFDMLARAVPRLCNGLDARIRG